MSNKYTDYEEWMLNDPVAVFLQSLKNIAMPNNGTGRNSIVLQLRSMITPKYEQFLAKSLSNHLNLTTGNQDVNHIDAKGLFNTVSESSTVRGTVIIDALKSAKALQYAWLYHKRQEPTAQPKAELMFKINSDGTVVIVNSKGERVTSYIPDTVDSKSIEQCTKMTPAGTAALCKKVLEVVLGMGPDAKSFGTVDDFKAMKVESKVSFAYSLCKSLHWPLKNEKMLMTIKEIPDLQAGDVFVDALAKLVNAGFTYRANGASTIGNAAVTEFFEHCVELVNMYPEMIELRPTQKFSQPKPRWNMRMRPEWIQNAQIKNIMTSAFGMVGGARILMGGENGVQYGGGISGFADAFASNLDRLVLLLKSQGKALTPVTAQKIRNHINTIRDLETKLIDFAKDLNRYINNNPNDGLSQVDETQLKTFNATSKQLTNKIVLVSDGLFKITGHLTNELPATKPVGHRRL